MATTYHKTTGIVLRAKPFSEADRLLTIYSKKLGKIHALAKGARKMKSRLGGRLDVLNCCFLFLAKGRSFYIVSQCETREVFKTLKQDYEKMQLAMECAGLLSSLTPWEEPQKNLFDLLLHVLLCLDEGIGDYQSIRAFFQFKLLAFCGYRPRFEHCIFCGKEKNLFYSLYERGAVCSTCVSDGSGGGARFSLSAPDIRFLNELAKARSAQHSFSHTKQVQRLLSALLDFHREGRAGL